MWHTDEIMIKVGGKWQYLWNTIDHSTKFMLANNLTKERFREDAQKVFKKAKKTADRRPNIMVTDGLQSYKQAFKDVFYSNQEKELCKHIPGVGIRNEQHNNNVVERYHGTVRERDKQ